MSPSKVTAVDFTTFANIINGAPRTAKNTYHGTDPTTKAPNWPVPIATAVDVDDAVAAANTAFQSWKLVPYADRQAHIGRFKDALTAYASEFTDLLIRETGKPRAMATYEVATTAQFADWYTALPEPQGTRHEDDEKTVVNGYVPLGVAAAICPWNFPYLIAFNKILPAVLMGNAVIVKPSPFTPYTALKMVEIAQQVFPAGVVQVLGGDDTLGPALVAHAGIHKVSFTGSVATGKKVMQVAARTVKRVTLEMGGNDPAIVLADADVQKVAPMVAMGAFMNTGQVCAASKRVYVHSSIYKEFLAALVAAAGALKVGSSDEEGVALGPIQNEMQYGKVKDLFADTKTHGYKLALGSADVADSKGFFINPTIVDNPPDDSRVVAEEAFGPIVPVQSYEDVDEVIRRANALSVGLGATVFGTDAAALQRVADRIESGVVWVNSFPQPAIQGQFGGVKESGIGTENGHLGVLAYVNVKCITTFKR